MTNVAVKVDGQRPIGARARRLREPRLLLVSHIGGRDSGVSTETVCNVLDDLKDYSQPHAPGRVVCVFVFVRLCVCLFVLKCVCVCVLQEPC